MRPILLVLLLLVPQTDSTVDKVIREGKENNKVMEHLDRLINKIGPRLTGSARLTEACEWTRGEFEKWGLKARLEEWGTFAVGFDRGAWSAKMIAPEEKDLTIGTNSWMPGTNGPVTGPAVLAPANDDQLKEMKPALKGAWIMSTSRIANSYQVAYDEAGIAGIIRSAGSDLVVTDGNPNVTWDKLPKRVVVRMISSDHKRILEHLKAGKEVKLTIDIKNEFKRGPIKLYNVIADLPGTEKPDEYVVVGGHIDSWDGATGTTDNGTGVATTLEAARLLATSGAKPRRTIRFMLWSGEEQGLLGSRAYIKAHPDEMKRISAVLVHDGGTNYVSGISATEAMVPIFEKAFAPVLDLDAEMKFAVRKVKALPRGIGSDHDAFLAAGVPGFFWSQSGRAKYGYTHHTQHDTFDKAIPEYQKHTSVVVAVGAWGIANLEGLLPRDGLAAVAAPSGRRLGVQCDDEMAITQVVEGSVAEKIGLREGDRILTLDGKPISDLTGLREAIQAAPLQTKILIRREGKDLELAVAFPEEKAGK